MATATKVQVQEAEKRKRTRSPAFPFINLETALRRAKEFYGEQQHHAAPVKVAVKLWGYEEKSSGGLQTTAALVSFGLLSDVGMGFHRRVSLTPLAQKILLNPDANDREQAIKQAALNPKIHRTVWQKWGPNPPEATLRYALLAEWEPKFNPKTVDAFIHEYRDTIAFAKLTESDKVTSEVKDSGDEEGSETTFVPKVGDWVQWEHNGVLGLPEPKQIKGFSSDREWAYVDGQNGACPTRELIPESAPLNAKTLPAASLVQRQESLPKTYMQEFVVPLSDGSKAVFQWPSTLSKADADDIKDSLKIVERKITRSIAEEKSAES